MGLKVLMMAGASALFVALPGVPDPGMSFGSAAGGTAQAVDERDAAGQVKIGRGVGGRGQDGASGQDGKPGRDGANGRPGRPGRDGADGKPGKDGKSANGKPGKGKPGKRRGGACKHRCENPAKAKEILERELRSLDSILDEALR